MAKPMVYKPKREVETLVCDTYRDIHFVILSLGTHPCCYIRIPNDSKFYDPQATYTRVDDIPLDVHGGITYASTHLNTPEGDFPGHWIGWDYAHLDDYYEYGKEVRFSQPDAKKWTTEELIRDCKDAIDQFIELCNEPKEDEK